MVRPSHTNPCLDAPRRSHPSPPYRRLKSKPLAQGPAIDVVAKLAEKLSLGLFHTRRRKGRRKPLVPFADMAFRASLVALPPCRRLRPEALTLPTKAVAHKQRLIRLGQRRPIRFRPILQIGLTLAVWLLGPLRRQIVLGPRHLLKFAATPSAPLGPCRPCRRPLADANTRPDNETGRLRHTP